MLLAFSLWILYNVLEKVRRGILVALFFMTLDHLAAFGFEIPVIARYTTILRNWGRIAAPLFLFVLVQGMRHTRSKPRFLFRLYLAGIGSELFVTATNFFLGEAIVYQTPGNVIFTFFYVVLYSIIIDGSIGDCCLDCSADPAGSLLADDPRQRQHPATVSVYGSD